MKNKLKGFLQRILQEIINEIIIGTSDTWSMRRSSQLPSNPATQQPSDPPYYIEDCRILGFVSFLDAQWNQKISEVVVEFEFIFV